LETLTHTLEIHLDCICGCKFTVEAKIDYPRNLYDGSIDPFADIIVTECYVKSKSLCDKHKDSDITQAAEVFVCEYLDTEIPLRYLQLLSTTDIFIENVDLETVFEF